MKRNFCISTRYPGNLYRDIFSIDTIGEISIEEDDINRMLSELSEMERSCLQWQYRDKLDMNQIIQIHDLTKELIRKYTTQGLRKMRKNHWHSMPYPENIYCHVFDYHLRDNALWNWNEAKVCELDELDKEGLFDVLATFTPFMQECAKLRYQDGLSLLEIAEKLGVKQNKVSLATSQIGARLRREKEELFFPI